MRRRRENRRYGKRQLKRQGMTFLFVILFLAFSLKGMAEEADDGNLLSVELPIPEEGEISPFDFVLDPYGLLYRTGAEKYGGGSVEEGATLLFRNREGEYAFSRCSDYLTVVNQGEQPVVVTVSAIVSGLEGTELSSVDDFSECEEGVIYLALTDEAERMQPLSTEGEVSLSRVVEPGTWSIRLTGACNPDADWQRMTSVYPRISVRWYVEPVEEPETDTKQDNPEEAGEGEKENSDSAEPPEDNDSEEETEDSTGTENQEDSDGTEPPEDNDSEQEPPEESAGEDSENQEISISGNDSLTD